MVADRQPISTFLSRFRFISVVGLGLFLLGAPGFIINQVRRPIDRRQGFIAHQEIHRGWIASTNLILCSRLTTEAKLRDSKALKRPEKQRNTFIPFDIRHHRHREVWDDTKAPEAIPREFYANTSSFTRSKPPFQTPSAHHQFM